MKNSFLEKIKSQRLYFDGATGSCLQSRGLPVGTPPEVLGLEAGDTVHLAVSLDRNEYRGTVSVSVIVKDLRFADTVQEDVIAAERLFDRLMCGEALTADERDAVTPTREAHLVPLYRYLKERGEFEGSFERLHHIFHDTIPCAKLRPTVEVLRQAGLITVANAGDSIRIELAAVSGKTDIHDTPLMERLQK